MPIAETIANIIDFIETRGIFAVSATLIAILGVIFGGLRWSGKVNKGKNYVYEVRS